MTRGRKYPIATPDFVRLAMTMYKYCHSRESGNPVDIILDSFVKQAMTE